MWCLIFYFRLGGVVVWAIPSSPWGTVQYWRFKYKGCNMDLQGYRSATRDSSQTHHLSSSSQVLMYILYILNLKLWSSGWSPRL